MSNLVSDLRVHVVRPVLRRMKMHSQAAEDLLMGTALAETGLRHLVQIRGPAVSLWQMEPLTFKDLHQNYLRYRPELMALCVQFLAPYPDAVDQLKGNLFYGAAIARLHYWRIPHELPTDLEGQALYWKQWWNTKEGAGTAEHYTRAWHAAYGGG